MGKWMFVVAIYIFVGFLVSYYLWSANGPDGSTWSPQVSTIAGWPYKLLAQA